MSGPSGPIGTSTQPPARGLRAPSRRGSWRVRREWDLLVIGGGVHGAAIARDAAARGLSTLLVEKTDFGAGTSSRSSKLAHGGLRYLEHLEVGLVRESLRERDALLRIAPHLSWPLPFLIPLTGPRPRAGWKVRIGLSIYDLLSGRSSLGHHEVIDAREAIRAAPALDGCGLDRAARYYDAGMDDARIVVELVVDAHALGASCVSHARATRLLRDGERVTGAVIEEADGRTTEVRARVTTLACGPWTDLLAHRRPDGRRRLALTKGAHVFLERRLVRDAALMLAAPQDGRIFFVIPWKGGTLIGTTDTAYTLAPDGARPMDADVKYLVRAVNSTLPAARVKHSELVAAQAGLRPLIAPDRPGRPSSISRDYRLDRATAGLIVVEGGKYTIFRKLAESVVDAALDDVIAADPERHIGPCVTHDRLLPGAAPAWSTRRAAVLEGLPAQVPESSRAHLVDRYGIRAGEVIEAAGGDPAMLRPACDEHPHLLAEAVHAVRRELARTPADALLRRLELGWTSCGGVRCADAWTRAFRATGWRKSDIVQGLAVHERELDRDWRP